MSRKKMAGIGAGVLCLVVLALLVVRPWIETRSALRLLERRAQENALLASQGKGHFVFTHKGTPARKTDYLVQFKGKKRYWEYEEPESAGRTIDVVVFNGEKVLNLSKCKISPGESGQIAYIEESSCAWSQPDPARLPSWTFPWESTMHVIQWIGRDFASHTAREKSEGGQHYVIIDGFLRGGAGRRRWSGWFSLDQGGWPTRAEVVEAGIPLGKSEITLKRYANGAWFPLKMTELGMKDPPVSSNDRVLEAQEDFEVGVEVPDSAFTWQGMGAKFPLRFTDQTAKPLTEYVYETAEDAAQDRRKIVEVHVQVQGPASASQETKSKRE